VFFDLKFEIVIHFMLIFYISLKFVNILQILLRKQKEKWDLKKLLNEEFHNFHLSLSPALVINF